MTIKNILTAIKKSDKPVARVLHKGKGFNVLAIGFAEGAVLDEHSSKTKAKLTVLRGSVKYSQGGASHILHEHDEHDIPVGEIHTVVALKESLCLLTQGD